MTAHATALLGLDFVRVEELHYGKLVTAEGGHVPMGEGYTTTYRTKGLLHPDRVLPTKLFDGALLQPDRIEEPFRRKGALFFRLVGETLVAMRARYRPEGGEERPGRTYLQASILQVEAREGFAGVPPALIPGFDELLVANPDLITTPAAERLKADPRDEPFEFGPRLSKADAAAWEPKQRARILTIISAMRGSAPITIGYDSFDDPAQGVDTLLHDFLHDVGLALAVMVQGRTPVSRDFQIACGLSAEVAGRSLMLSSVAPSTRQSSSRWDEILQMIDAPRAAAARPGSTPSNIRTTTERPANVPSLSTFDRTNDIGWGSPPVQSPPPSVGRPPTREPGETPSAAVEWRDAPVVALPAHKENFSWQANSTAESTNNLDDQDPFDLFEKDSSFVARPGTIQRSNPREHALAEFHQKFSYARCDEPPPGSFASLLEYAADASTGLALKSWNPFDTSDPSPAHILLGLLLGLLGRGDLLDRYAFVEFFCIWRQMPTMSASDSRDKWVRHLIKCTDHRIGKLGILTRKELQLLRTYESFYRSDLSDSTNKILTADHKYHQYRDGLSPRERAVDPEKRSIVLDAFGRLQRRYFKSKEDQPENLLFSTFDMTPDDKSIFHLTDRPIVTWQSTKLLSAELAAAHDLVPV